MTINYTSLTDELIIITEVEHYIDGELRNKYIGNSMLIDLNVANMSYVIGRTSKRNLIDIRRNLMYQNLVAKYKEAGWKYEEKYGDIIEMASNDYLKFSDKN